MINQATMSSVFDLKRLLHPMTPDQFLADFWERKDFFLKRNDDLYYQNLLSYRDIDRLIVSAQHLPDFTLALIKDGTITHRVGDGVRRFGSGNALTIDRLDPATAYREFDAGATIRLTRIERLLRSVSILAGEIERQINAETSVNLYLTPPESQAFHPHIDLHDVLILQLSGRKTWRLFAPDSALPVERIVEAHRQLHSRPLPHQEPAFQAPESNDQATEIVLEPGDLLYLPRGYPHCASTGDESSLHLTVGQTALTYHELVIHTVTRELGKERLLRTGLSPGFISNAAIAQSLVDQSTTFAETIERALSAENLLESARDLAKRFVYSRQTRSEGQLREIEDLAELDLDTALRIRPGLTTHLDSRPDGIYLLFSGRILTLPAKVAHMVRYMMRVRSFKVREIESDLSDKSRLILCRKLIAEGLLARQPESCQPPLALNSATDHILEKQRPSVRTE